MAPWFGDASGMQNPPEVEALFQAARDGNLQEMNRLLDRHPEHIDAWQGEWNHSTPLSFAIRAGHADAMRLLISRGAHVGSGYLFDAVYHGCVDTVKILIEHGANPDVLDIDHVTPLYWAAIRGWEEIGRLLIQNGAELVSPYLPADAGHRGFAEMLVEHGAPYSRVHLAAMLGDAAMIEEELASGVDVNSTDYGMQGTDWTPLQIASRHGRKEAASVLIRNGADLDFHGVFSYGETALMGAIHFHHTEVAVMLIESGADVNHRNNARATPLHLAAEGGDLTVARLLIEHGADRHAMRRAGGLTPIELAEAGDMPEMVELLRQ